MMVFSAMLALVFAVFAMSFTGADELYMGDIVSDGIPIDNVAEEDPQCSHHTHKFYRKLGCEPELTQDSKCPTSYKCAVLQNRSSEVCYFNGHSYQVGSNITRDSVDFHTPCVDSCQCVRLYEGARFVCNQESVKDCPSAPGCKRLPFLEDFSCCQAGVTSCNQGKQDSVKCVYDGRSYSEGEKFFPADDVTCTQCVCASGFNGTIAAPYCRKLSCVLELWGDTPHMLTRGCIPVYLSEQGCCPISYRCPKKTDLVVKRKTPSGFPSRTDKTCHFGNLTMEIGDTLSPWLVANPNERKVECSCRVPPLATCVRQGFALSDQARAELARGGLDDEEKEP